MKLLALLISLVGLSAAYGASKAVWLSADLLDDLDDDTAVVQATINSMPTDSALHIPAGILTLSQPLVIDRPSFAIIGADANLTTLRFTSATNGLVFFSSGADGNYARVADLTIQTSASGSGAAIFGDTVNSNEPPLIYVDRVEIKGLGAGFWKYGLRMIGGSGLVTDSVFQGVNNGLSGTVALVEHTGQTGGGGRIQMFRSRLIGADRGVSVFNTDAEGQKFFDSMIEDVAIAAYRATSEPGFHWIGCRFTAGDTAFYLKGARDTAIAGNIIETTKPNSQAIVLQSQQMQHLAFRANVISGANAVKVPQETGEKLVDSVTFSGNYIQTTNSVFDLRGTQTYSFSLGGNIRSGTGTEFILGSDTQKIFKTKTQALTP